MDRRFYSLWAINAPLDRLLLCKQLDAMRQLGFDGVVFHPRFYPNMPKYLSEEYLTILSSVILHARQIGLEFWLYDENGWPSGTVGGELLQRFPEDAQQWADLTTDGPENSRDRIASFEHEGQRWFVCRRQGAGVDYLNPNLARHFLELTHERYRLGLDARAFEHISTFFCDEPEFGLGHAYDQLSPHGAIPWTTRLPELFQQRYGRDLSGVLPQLFFPANGYAETRVQFWELLTDLFCDSFITLIDNWCREHGKRFTAHMKGEEHPLFQVPMVGSCHQVFRRLGLPGIDALERFPSGDFFPRQVASAAHQYGDGRSMVECFGGAGWGARPEDFERYLLWLGRHGITDFVVHLWQYQLNSHAIRDWPASIPVHLNWRDVFPSILRHVKAELISESNRSIDTLVISPHRGIMAEYKPSELSGMNIHNAATYENSIAGQINTSFLGTIQKLKDAKVGYHLVDERGFEDATVDGQLLQIGHCKYKSLIIPPGCVFNLRGEELIQRAQAAGIMRGVGDIPVSSKVMIDALRPDRSIVLNWKPVDRPTNFFVPHIENVGPGLWRTIVESRVPISAEICIADAVVKAHVNETELTPISAVGEWRSCALRPSSNEIILRTRSDIDTPIVWIRGLFLVRSSSSFGATTETTITTDGPFYLDTQLDIPCNCLTEAGYPFARVLPRMRAAIHLPIETNELIFEDVDCDAMQVWIDGRDVGYIYGPAWQLALPIGLPWGNHALEISLIPSTYNFFGPHHHIDGDRHVVSPDQFAGKKNFADRPDAPTNTRIKAWRFKPVHSPRNLILNSRIYQPKL